MRKTRLFIGHNPELTNGSLEHSVDSSNNPVMEGWNVPAGNTFETDNGQTFLVPYPDNTNGDYAVTQDIGVTGPGVVELEIGYWYILGGNGAYHIQIGDAWLNLPSPSHNNVVDIQTPGGYKIIGKFIVTQPDPVLGYKLAIRGAGGGGVPGNMPIHRGVRYIKLLSYDTFYQEVDLYDELDIPVTYNVADVRDISKKDSNFSLTVSLPNTGNNAQLFDCIHEIARYGSGFEMLKQYPAYIEVDNNRTFEGYLKLTKVVINDDKEVSYECNLYSNFIEFVKRLGTSTLRGNENSLEDLSFSEYTMTLDEDTWFHQTDLFNWDTTPDPDEPISERPWGKGCYFSIVDKFNISGDPLNNRLTTNTHGRNGINLFFDEMTPFLFYKEIWDKIFEQAGFSYVSEFIETGGGNTTPFAFDHLAYPAVNFRPGTTNDFFSEVHQDNWAHNPLFPSWVYPNYDVTIAPWNGSDNVISGVVNPMFKDTMSQLAFTENPTGQTTLSSITPWSYTFPQGGVWHLKVNIPWKFQFNLMYTGGSSASDTQQVDADSSRVYSFNMYLIYEWVDPNNVTQQQVIWQDNYGGNYESQYDAVSGRITAHSGTISIDQDIYPVPGARLYFTTNATCHVKTGNNYTFVATGSGSSYGDNRGHEPILSFDRQDIGSTLIDIRLVSDYSIDGVFDPTVILNPKRKKLDFVNDIIKKFNLYVEDVTNKKDANGVYYRDYTTPNVRRGEPILRIEPRPMYYQNPFEIRDWTNRVETSSIEFERIDDYIYKWLDFNDKDDKTFHVEDYNSYNYIEGEYGEEKITSPMNTSEDEKTEIKTTLGQTMCGNPFGKKGNVYLEYPLIYSLDNDGSVKSDKQFEDRMLFAFNVYPGSDPYNIYPWDFQGIWNSSTLQWWRIYIRDNANPGQFTDSIQLNHDPYPMRTWVALNTFNVPFGSETADLNFGWANWYYQNLNGTWATSNNCYNVFYKDMVEEYNDPNARMMTCKMYLTPADIRDVKLSDVIIVNDVAYHINKISQWKNGEEPVKVELIKIISSDSRWKVNPKGPAVRENRPPVLEYITPVKLRDDLAAVGKLVEENTEAIAGDKTAIDAILKTISELDERLKKLEGKTMNASFSKERIVTPDEVVKWGKQYGMKITDSSLEQWEEKRKRELPKPSDPKVDEMKTQTQNTSQVVLAGQLYHNQTSQFNKRNNPIGLNLD